MPRFLRIPRRQDDPRELRKHAEGWRSREPDLAESHDVVAVMSELDTKLAWFERKYRVRFRDSEVDDLENSLIDAIVDHMRGDDDDDPKFVIELALDFFVNGFVFSEWLEAQDPALQNLDRAAWNEMRNWRDAGMGVVQGSGVPRRR